jgi:hypothetical protein
MKYIYLVTLSLFLISCDSGYKVNGKNVTWVIYDKGIGGGKSTYIVEDVDISTFKKTKVNDNSRDYAKDKNHIYYCGNIIIGADPNSYQHHKGDYYKDKKSIFLDHAILKGSDPNSFEHITECWSKDSQQVYYYSHVIKPLDIDSYTPLSGPWSYDDKTYYFGAHIVTGADRSTFVINDQHPYSQDKNNLFWAGRIIEECDIESFVIDGRLKAHDKNYSYTFRFPTDDNSSIIKTKEPITDQFKP